MKSYPDNEPAWVESPADGSWRLHWLDADGKPAEEIGVLRECDVPGIHTPGAAQRIASMPLSKQLARVWASEQSAAKPVSEAPESGSEG